MQTDRQMISIILGGGAGTRLSPLTMRRSKPAVPLAGKYRLIDIPVSNCLNSGVYRMFVLTQFNSASLNRHISNTYRFDNFSRGFVTILAAEQTPLSKDWFQGTADAVRQVLHHVDGFAHTHTLILSGDQLYSMDYSKMLHHHQQHEADLTIATIPVPASDAPGFGILKTNEQHVITEFHEKPAQDKLAGLESPVSENLKAQGKEYLASMGIYIFNREILREELTNNENFTDFGKEIIPHAIDKRKVISYPFAGYWSDIGTIRSFYEANLELTKPQPPFDLYDPIMPLYTRPRILAPSKIQNSEVVSSLIAEGCIVEDSVIHRSVIGIRSFISRNTTIKDSVLLGADYYPWHHRSIRDYQTGADHPGVGEGSHIEKAIVDKNVCIGKKCVIKNTENVQEGEGPNFYIRDGIVIIPKNVTLADGTVI